jgi:hypothetical protein
LPSGARSVSPSAVAGRFLLRRGGVTSADFSQSRPGEGTGLRPGGRRPIRRLSCGYLFAQDDVRARAREALKVEGMVDDLPAQRRFALLPKSPARRCRCC